MESAEIALDATNDPSESIESSAPQEISLESLILRLLKTYTRYKLKERFGIEWNPEWRELKPELRNQNARYQEYREKKEHIAKDLHAEFRRHRHPHKFLAYFAGKFTGFYQYSTTKEYLLLAEQIQSQPERVQILCLLALIAL
jgi:CRISPR-associated protein Cmx8